jgi:hypothetical protein
LTTVALVYLVRKIFKNNLALSKVAQVKSYTHFWAVSSEMVKTYFQINLNRSSTLASKNKKIMNFKVLSLFPIILQILKSFSQFLLKALKGKSTHHWQDLTLVKRF